LPILGAQDGKSFLMVPALRKVRNLRNGEKMSLTEQLVESAISSVPPTTRVKQLVVSPSLKERAREIFLDPVFAKIIYDGFEVDDSLPSSEWFLKIEDGATFFHQCVRDLHKNGWEHVCGKDTSQQEDNICTTYGNVKR